MHSQGIIRIDDESTIPCYSCLENVSVCTYVHKTSKYKEKKNIIRKIKNKEEDNPLFSFFSFVFRTPQSKRTITCELHAFETSHLLNYPVRYA